MRCMNPRRLVVVAILIAAIAGCAKTNLTNLYKNPDGGTMQSILVVALERDPDLRRMWEDAITAEFQAAGVMARPGYALFPTQLPDSQQVVVVTRRDHYDGVVVTHRLPITHSANLDSDYSKSAPGGANQYWRGWYHTNYIMATQAAAPGDDELRFQIDVANTAGGGTLLWMGSTTPLKIDDEEKLRSEVCGELVSELTRQGLVAKRK
jgi:hypothetical protein